MCLITKKQPVVAERSFSVYKFLRKEGGKYFSNYFTANNKFYEYKPGVENEVKIQTTINPIFALFADEKDRLDLREIDSEAANSIYPDRIIPKGYFVYAEGFHSYASRKRATYSLFDASLNYVLVRFIVPKGALYVKDREVIVSNKIKMVKPNAVQHKNKKRTLSRKTGR
jgi:hypothetical protein